MHFEIIDQFEQGEIFDFILMTVRNHTHYFIKMLTRKKKKNDMKTKAVCLFCFVLYFSAFK